MMISLYQVRDESTMKSHAFQAGALYICNGSNHIYFDSVDDDKSRMLLTNSIIFNTEAERNACVPSEHVIYLVRESQMFYLYYENGWHGITDKDLTTEGKPADAKAVADAIQKVLEDAKAYTDETNEALKNELKNYTDDTVTAVIDSAKEYTDEAVRAINTNNEKKFKEIDGNFRTVTTRINALKGNPSDGLDTVEKVGNKAHLNAGEIAKLKIEFNKIKDNINSGISNIYKGAEAPEDELCNTWIDTSAEYAYLRYKNDAGEWITIAGGDGSQSDINSIYIGAEAPEDPIYNTWVDTSGEYAYLKYKNDAGEWITIAGGDGSKSDINSIYIGNTAPKDPIYNTWIDTSGEFTFLKYKNESGEWISIAGGSGSQGGGNIFIGNTAPEDDSSNTWIDTSGEFAYLKYKNEANEWVTIAGGNGSQGGNGSNIFIGTEAPIDENINTWIDTSNKYAYLKYKTEDNKWIMVYGAGGSEGGSESGSNIYIGAEEPSDPTCDTWIDTSEKYAFLKYKNEEGEWISIAGNTDHILENTSDSSDTVHIGPKPPVTNEYKLWVDTSREVAYVKYKNDKGEWITVSGGGGGGTGGSTNNAKLTVINAGGWLSKTIAYGSKCEIAIRWSSIEDEISTGPGTCTVSVGGTVRRAYEIQQGDLKIDVTSYLMVGSNDIQVSISDMYGNQRAIKFNVTTVAISINSYFNGNAAYTGDIAYTYTPVGELDKTVHFLLNGEEIGTQLVSTSNREQSYMLSSEDRPHGSYSLEVYFTGKIDSQPVESNHLYYEFAWYEENNNEPIITIPFNTLTAQQYDSIPFTYQVRSYSETTDTVELLEDGNVVMTLHDVGRKLQTWSYRAYEYGEITLGVRCGKVMKEKTIVVTKSNIDVAIEQNSLELSLTSHNRSNAEENPGIWENNGYSAEMTGFNWASNGWVTDDEGNTVLRLNGDARVNIPIKIFSGDLRTTGKTIEIDFATRDVLNYDTVILSSYESGRGINVTAQKATLDSEQCDIFTQYKEEEHVRIAFTIEKRVENRFLGIYINGILSGLQRYPENDNFAQKNPVGITIGSSDCTTDIFSIRIYNTSLTQYQIVDNWIADTQNIDLMLERYERNRIFDAYGNITIANLPKGLPYMVLYVDDYSKLPQYKGDKQTISGKYVDPMNPERSFSWEKGQMNVQGTSSAGYSRKNYKLKFKNGLTMTATGEQASLYALREDSIPTVEFCLKADVASSEGANNVELVKLYCDIFPEDAVFPPKLKDTRARQGIEGYPMVVFYGLENQEMHFLGKYNFNNDKGTNEVYGLFDDDESWEITDNSSNLVVWKGDNEKYKDGSYFFEEVTDKDGNPVPRWTNSFEARHPEDNMEIGKLLELATWINSTDIYADGITEEEKAARKQKFIDEFENWFNKDAMIFNYIFTEMFLMVDSRAKNAFPTRYGEDGKWLILPYDYDTAIGISNTGELKFGYELEDIDRVDGAYVYNGQNSVLFVNIRECFFDEIRTMYQKLRTQKEPYPFTYEEVTKRFRDHQMLWGESIYNEDARFKYIEPTIEGSTMYLPMVQGSKEEQRKWWLYNRFRYMDSKYNAGDAETDIIFMRNYSSGDITITPYADIYAIVDFDQTRQKVRAFRGQPWTIHDPRTETDKEMVTTIYSASQLSDIGDLSALQCGRVDFSNAKRLRSLKFGSSEPGFVNQNLRELEFSNMPLLRSIDITNCINFKQTLNFTSCANIEHIYAEGTQITGLILPDGGIVKTLHLPETVVNVKIVNQMQLEDLKLPNYDKLETVWLEKVNWNVFDANSIIADLRDGTYVRIIGVDWTMPTVAEIYSAMDNLDRFHGLGEDDSRLDKAVVGGVIHTGHITGDEKMAMYLRYPNLKIDCSSFEAVVKFFVNGELVYGPITVRDYGSCEDPIELGIIETPTKEEDDKGRYIYEGWSEDISKVEWNYDCEPSFRLDPKYYISFYDEKGDIIQVNGKDKNYYYNAVGENVVMFPDEVPELHYNRGGIDYIHRFDHWENSVGDRINEYIITGGRNTDIKIYAKYNEYRVWVTKFMNDDTEHSVQYKCTGETIELPETPKRQSTHLLGYIFDGWSLDGENIVEVPTVVGEADVTYHAVYHSYDIYHTLAFINEGLDLYRNEKTQYGFKITPPEDPTKESDNYLNYDFAGWSLDGENVVEVANTVGDEDLIYVAVYESSTRYYTVNFYQDETLLTTVKVTYGEDAIPDIPEPVHPDDYTFIGWEPGNIEITEDRDCKAKFVYFLTHRFLRRSLIEVYSDESLLATYALARCQDLEVLDLPFATSIGENACYYCLKLNSINIPFVSNVASYAFAECRGLTNANLPMVSLVNQSAFYRCSNLQKVDIGRECTIIGDSAFRSCTSLVTVIIRNYDNVCTITSSSFMDSPIINTSSSVYASAYVYVPRDMIDLYKASALWKPIVDIDKLRAIEDYPEICDEEV